MFWTPEPPTNDVDHGPPLLRRLGGEDVCGAGRGGLRGEPMGSWPAIILRIISPLVRTSAR